MTDCIVIGGGLIGMLTARELAAAGMKVTLLERGEPGRESSWAGGGIISPLYPWRYDDAVSHLVAWSQARYPGLCTELLAESGVDPEYTPSGLMILDTDELAEARSWAGRFHAGLELIDRGAIHAQEPALQLVQDQAIWMPGVGQVRNPRLVKALKGSLANNPDIELIENTEVISISRELGRVTGVVTASAEYGADRVVVASGAWSAGLLAGLGVKTQIEPVRGQMILFRAEPGVLQHIVLYRDHYLIPRRDGRILAGSTLEYTGFEKQTTAEALAELKAFALERVPALAEYPVEHHWAGLRPGSPKGIPLICGHPGIRGLFINAGHFRNGVVLGPASVHVLVGLLTGAGGDIVAAPYGLGG